ncbi:TIGR02391 family protein [Rathayibacter sp. AY1D4]|uniref:TIGR02391 family protein n=1 Tax=Rathayibacter sp. AY1D4 TaxID=2080545 RepID=UPI001CA579D1|nr:TIGR02391 family protein [Rathayibacter sp. AY1D4]
MDSTWALEELARFEALTQTHLPRGQTFSSTIGKPSDVVAAAQVVEQILDRVLPTWRTDIPEGRVHLWTKHREAALRATVAIERKAELDEKLGDAAPAMTASGMHPWIWDAARSLWTSSHFRQAVSAAAAKVNAEAQNKLGRRDVSETDLFNQAFSSNAPAADKPRLKLAGDDGGKTALSARRGVMAFAEGCFAAIRNPASHDYLDELAEAEALEQLAAFSLLARWVDGATVERG